MSLENKKPKSTCLCRAEEFPVLFIISAFPLINHVIELKYMNNIYIKHLIL